MNIQMNGPTLVLDARQRLALIDAAGTVASVKSGSVWITMENDQRDVVLAPGDVWTIERNGRTLLQAEEVSTVVLTEAVPARHNVIDHLRDGVAVLAHRLRRAPSRAQVPYY